VAFSPGGPNDVMARILAAKLSANLGQQFIVENKPGAGGTIGTSMVAKAQADGYTLLFNSAPFVTAPALYGSKLSYDTLRDITGITKVAESPLVLMTNPQSPHKSLKGLIAAAKATPGKLNFGSGGVASTPHLATSLLEVLTATNFTHIPYKGGGPAITALMGGEIDILLDSITSGGPFLTSGKLRGLAVTGTKRAAKLPDVPTFAEAGMPEYKRRCQPTTSRRASLNLVQSRLSAPASSSMSSSLPRSRNGTESSSKPTSNPSNGRCNARGQRTDPSLGANNASPPDEGCCHAQSSVTVYEIVDASVHYADNAAASGALGARPGPGASQVPTPLGQSTW
jgi:hypothetical protein